MGLLLQMPTPLPPCQHRHDIPFSPEDTLGETKIKKKGVLDGYSPAMITPDLGQSPKCFLKMATIPPVLENGI